MFISFRYKRQKVLQLKFVKVCGIVSFVLFLTLIGLYELGIPVPIV